jgi:hypothetical protein
MIRQLVTLAAAAAIAGIARGVQAQAVAIRATAPPPPPPTVVVQGSAPPPAYAVVSDGGGATRPGVSVAGLLGFGVAESTGFFAFGARGGYTFPTHLYVGGELGYGVVGNSCVTIDGITACGNTNPGGIFHLQGEAGYEFGFARVPPLLIRPYGGLGFADFTGGGGGADFLLSPGVVSTYEVLWHFVVGVDLRIPIYLGSYSTVGFSMFATGGYKF